MKRGLYFAFAAAALGAGASCVFVIGDRAEMEVRWAVTGTSDDADVADGCAELGATGVEVVTERRGSGSVEIDIFDCDRGEAVIERRLGDYDVWVNAIDGEDRLYGQSVVVTDVPLDTSDDYAIVSDYLPAGDFGFQNGTITGRWELYDRDDGFERTCSEVGVGGVSVLTTLASDGGTAFDDIFDCPADAVAGEIETGPLPLSTFAMDMVVLEEGTDEVLSDEVVKEGSISSHRGTEDLGVYEFLFR